MGGPLCAFGIFAQGPESSVAPSTPVPPEEETPPIRETPRFEAAPGDPSPNEPAVGMATKIEAKDGVTKTPLFSIDSYKVI